MKERHTVKNAIGTKNEEGRLQTMRTIDYTNDASENDLLESAGEKIQNTVSRHM